MIHLRSLIVSFLLFAVLITSLAYGTNVTPKNYYSKPEGIIGEIKVRGARAVVIELTEDWAIWDYICDKVATGNQAWLKTAVALQAGTDAGASETLDMALGEALEHNPKDVFKIGGKKLDLEFVCSGPDVDNPRYDSYERSLRALNLRISKVATVNDPTLKDTRKNCLEFLEKSKKGLAQFFEINKE